MPSEFQVMSPSQPPSPVSPDVEPVRLSTRFESVNQCFYVLVPFSLPLLVVLLKAIGESSLWIELDDRLVMEPAVWMLS